jgi:hypothetical protein
MGAMRWPAPARPAHHAATHPEEAAMRPIILAALFAALALPAAAQSGSCAQGGPNGGPRASLTGISIGTQMVPRGPEGRELETITGVFTNTTGEPLTVRITLLSRAFQTNRTVLPATLRAGVNEVVLGNALRGQITRANMASALMLDCL